VPEEKVPALPRRIVWEPQPRQASFLARPEPEALYGGAAGGGKSDALLAEALRQVEIPHYRALILRKTYPQMSDLVDRSMAIYPQSFPGAEYNAGAHCWRFPSGAKIYFGSMQYKKDRTNYQGKAYDFIAFDELTHFEWEEYSYMMSRNRPTGPGTRVYMRAATNPGGIGHGWVRSRFISPAPSYTPITEQYTVQGPGKKTLHLSRARVFIPSTVFDNRKLLDNDPQYLANLAALPEAEKQALLYGWWDSFEGQVFTEWRDDPAHYSDQRWTHVIAPFSIPLWWKIWRGYDFGYSKPFSVGWYAADDAQRTENVQTFLHAVEHAAGLYCSTDWLKRRLNTCELTDTNLWIAQYASACTAPLMPCIWQYSSTGHMDGIAGKVDRDVLYFAPHAPAQLQKELPCMPNLGSAGLEKGCRGPYAVNLQKILKAIGLAPGGADGVFGYKTRATVVAFQAQQGLQTDGIVGPATKAALERAWKKKQNAGA
jgi:hypothetical protein